jgi:hypothetical protein
MGYSTIISLNAGPGDILPGLFHFLQQKVHPVRMPDEGAQLKKNSSF